MASSHQGRLIKYSLVVPVYRTEAFLHPLLERVRHLASVLDAQMEVVFVVDGSPDDSYQLLRAQLPAQPFPAQLLTLSRNFGSFAAIRAGLEAARGEHFVIMTADLQEPEGLVVELFTTLQDRDVDVVVGTRRSRDDGWLSSLASNAFWAGYRTLVQPAAPKGGIDVFGCKMPVRDTLIALREANSSLIAQLLWVGFRRKEIPYERLARAEGRSGWSFRKRVRYLTDSLFSFTDLPILLVTLGGLVGTLITGGTAVVVLVYWALGRITIPGYTAIVLAILLSTFTILLVLGVVGNYVWRTYENSKQRPLSIEMERHQFEGHQASLSPILNQQTPSAPLDHESGNPAGASK